MMPHTPARNKRARTDDDGVGVIDDTKFPIESLAEQIQNLSWEDVFEGPKGTSDFLKLVGKDQDRYAKGVKESIIAEVTTTTESVVETKQACDAIGVHIDTLETLIAKLTSLHEQASIKWEEGEKLASFHVLLSADFNKVEPHQFCSSIVERLARSIYPKQDWDGPEVALSAIRAGLKIRKGTDVDAIQDDSALQALLDIADRRSLADNMEFKANMQEFARLGVFWRNSFVVTRILKFSRYSIQSKQSLVKMYYGVKNPIDPFLKEVPPRKFELTESPYTDPWTSTKPNMNLSNLPPYPESPGTLPSNANFYSPHHAAAAAAAGVAGYPSPLGTGFAPMAAHPPPSPGTTSMGAPPQSPGAGSGATSQAAGSASGVAGQQHSLFTNGFVHSSHTSSAAMGSGAAAAAAAGGAATSSPSTTTPQGPPTPDEVAAAHGWQKTVDPKNPYVQGYVGGFNVNNKPSPRKKRARGGKPPKVPDIGSNMEVCND